MLLGPADPLPVGEDFGLTAEFDDGDGESFFRILDFTIKNNPKNVGAGTLLIALFEGYEERFKALGLEIEYHGFSN